MDYPDSEEEFELMHAAEFEAMREMEEEEAEYLSRPKSKRSLDFSDAGTASVSKLPVPVSTLSVPSNEESANNTGSSVGCTPLDLPTKRTSQELFGDTADLDDDDSPPLSNERKKPRLEEESTEQDEYGSMIEDEHAKEVRQDLVISRIVEARNKSRNLMRPLATRSVLARFKKIEDCMTTVVPQWPFMPVCGFGDRRIYLRLHSQEFFEEQLQPSGIMGRHCNLLSLPYSELEQLAKLELEKMRKRKGPGTESGPVVTDNSSQLLVERYKPRNYLELLSDEGTNRSLLQWLKLWDKVVFGRSVPKNERSQTIQTKLNMELDETDRPQSKVALLCGPPGLGKTTLAHLIAAQAGYNAVEVNASDDRSAQVFKAQIEAATQMKAVLGQEKRPNCLVLDEIDGAPSAAIDVLVNFAVDKQPKGKNKKQHTNAMLKRPIICICNDAYVPALRPLRQIAFTLHFPPTSSARLAERLVEICRQEGVRTDTSCMMALGEKAENDIRACLAALHCIKSKTNKVSLVQIQNSNVGVKDVQQSLFAVWQAIFQIVKPKVKISVAEGFSKEQLSMLAECKCEGSTQGGRMARVMRVVRGCGDYDRLMQGVYENFPLLNSKAVSFSSLVTALKWFTFHDVVSQHIHSQQNYILYPYLVYGFVVWHFVFASFSWPKLVYPHKATEVSGRTSKLRQLVDYCLSGASGRVRTSLTRDSLLLDSLPLLLSIIQPSLRTMSGELLRPEEKARVAQVVSVMLDYNLTYTQERNQDAVYTYNLDPNLEEVGRFPDWKSERSLTYAAKQMISHQIDLEKMRRAELSLYKNTAASAARPGAAENNQGPSLPQLTVKPQPLGIRPEKVGKDFFGRRLEEKARNSDRDAVDEIVKSAIWFYFKEGHNNAVRKTLRVQDMLDPATWTNL